MSIKLHPCIVCIQAVELIKKSIIFACSIVRFPAEFASKIAWHSETCRPIGCAYTTLRRSPIACLAEKGEVDMKEKKNERWEGK